MDYKQKSVEEQKRISAETERLAQEYKKSPAYLKAIAKKEESKKTVSSGWKERARKDIKEKGYTVIAGAKFKKEEAEKILAEKPIQKAEPTPQKIQVPPEGTKEVTFTTEEAMRYGLISKETAKTQPDTVTLYVQKDVSKQDIITQSQYLKGKWLDIKRDREQIGKGRVPFETWAKLEEQETKTAEKIGQHPLIRTSYVLAKDWLGIGTLHSYAVTKITGGDWETEQKKMLTGYGRELMATQKDPMLKTVTLKSPVFGDVPFQPIASAGMGVKVASFYLMGRSPAIGFGVKAVTSAFGGYEIGTGIKMVAKTEGRATPQEAEQIARHFASGFLLTVPAQISVYGKGIQSLQKPKLQIQVAGTKEKFVYEQKGKITTTKSVAVEKIVVLERKGMMQRLHLEQPKQVGEIYGQTRTISQAGDVLGVSKTQHIYVGKIHGKPITLAGEEPAISIYRATPETVYGYTFSSPKSMFKISGKPTGDTRAYVVTRFGGTKYADTPKGEYWSMKTKTGGIQETHQILQKQTPMRKFKDLFKYEEIISEGKGFTVFEKKPEMKPFTKPPSPQADVKDVLVKTIPKTTPSVSVKPQTGMGAISGAKQLEQGTEYEQIGLTGMQQLGTGYEQIGLKGMVEFDMKYGTEEAGYMPAKELGFPQIPSGREFVEQKMKVLQTPLQKEMAIGKEKTEFEARSKEKFDISIKEGQMGREMNRIAQALGQAQAQKQAQKQRLGLKQMLAQRFIQTRSFKSFGRFGTFPAIPTFGKMKAKDILSVDEKEIGKMKFKAGLGKLSLKKTFFADLYSVTKSQLLFGKATHPALTEKEWGKAEKSFFVDVPTVELKKRGKNILKGII